MSHDAYITEPPLAKFIDRGGRALAYLALSAFSFLQMHRPGSFINPPSLWDRYTVALAIAGSVIALVAAVACVFKRSQIELITLPLLIGVLAADALLAGGALGLRPHVFLVLASMLFVTARYNVLRLTQARARLVKTINEA